MDTKNNNGKPSLKTESHDNKKVLYNHETHIFNPSTIIINKAHVTDKACALLCKEKGIDWQSKILFNGEEFNIVPGLMIGGMTYGFNVIFKDMDDIISQNVYPTELNVTAIEGRTDTAGKLTKVMVYENGKYKPWVFDASGELISESSFLDISRRDVSFMKHNFTDLNLSIEEKYNVRSKKLLNKN